MKIALALVLGLSLVFVAITWAALEAGGGVAVVVTRAEDGSPRSTHVWYVEEEGEFWLEAGTPENAWYQDVLRDPVLGFHAEARVGRYLAKPTEDRVRHRWLRERLAAKYGWRDRWVSLYVDQGRSLAVRLVLARERETKRVE
jgi:hypothetical protein